MLLVVIEIHSLVFSEKNRFKYPVTSISECLTFVTINCEVIIGLLPVKSPLYKYFNNFGLVSSATSDLKLENFEKEI